MLKYINPGVKYEYMSKPKVTRMKKISGVDLSCLGAPRAQDSAGSGP